MAGWFNPPPGPYVGGRQPYAGKDVVPPNGPTQSPAHPLSQANYNILIASWQDTTYTVIYFDQLTQQGPPPPPPPTQAAHLRVLLQAWDVVLPLPQRTQPIAHQLPPPSPPPRTSNAPLYNIIAINQPPAYAIPRAGTIAPLLPQPSTPPKTSNVTYNLLIDSWRPPVWWPLPALKVFPVSGQTPSPYFNAGQFAQILDSWKPPVWWPLPSLSIYPNSGPTPITVTPPPLVTRSAWTADSGIVTADSINFTCDGADLINNGGVDIRELVPGKSSNRLAYSVSVPLFVQLRGNN